MRDLRHLRVLEEHQTLMRKIDQTLSEKVAPRDPADGSDMWEPTSEHYWVEWNMDMSGQYRSKYVHLRY
jgi:hypothetical protein